MGQEPIGIAKGGRTADGLTAIGDLRDLSDFEVGVVVEGDTIPTGIGNGGDAVVAIISEFGSQNDWDGWLLEKCPGKVGAHQWAIDGIDFLGTIRVGSSEVGGYSLIIGHGCQ